MTDTNLYWQLRGTYAERKEKLSKMSREYLEAAILDSEYNEFLRARADYHVDEHDKHNHGKRLPYIGWFWRHLEFSDGTLPIGDCGQFIGFIANNKWNYSERLTTSDEFARIMTIIDEAMALNQQGGLMKEIVDNTNAKLDELWDYLQTLEVKA